MTAPPSAPCLFLIVEARNALEQMTDVELRKRPTLMFHLASLRSAIRPSFDATRHAVEVLQADHQKRNADDEPLFTDTGTPVYRDVLAFSKARRELDESPVAVELPRVRPLRYDQFPPDFPWKSWWGDALRALGWLEVPADVLREITVDADAEGTAAEG